MDICQEYGLSSLMNLKNGERSNISKDKCRYEGSKIKIRRHLDVQK